MCQKVDDVSAQIHSKRFPCKYFSCHLHSCFECIDFKHLSFLRKLRDFDKVLEASLKPQTCALPPVVQDDLKTIESNRPSTPKKATKKTTLKSTDSNEPTNQEQSTSVQQNKPENNDAESSQARLPEETDPDPDQTKQLKRKRMPIVRLERIINSEIPSKRRRKSINHPSL